MDLRTYVMVSRSSIYKKKDEEPEERNINALYSFQSSFSVILFVKFVKFVKFQKQNFKEYYLNFESQKV